MAVRSYPCPKSGVATKSARLRQCRSGAEDLPHVQGQGWRAKRSYSMFKVRRGGPEKIPLIQDKEQWLRFAGAAVKRFPTSKVRETQVRQ